jgi:hypothetical protein
MSHSRLGLADGWGLLQSMRFNQDRSAFVCAFQVTNKTVSGKSAGCRYTLEDWRLILQLGSPPLRSENK